MRIRLATLIAVVLNFWVSAAWAQQSQPPAASSTLPPQSTTTQPPTQTATNAPSTALEMPPLSSGVVLQPGSQESSTSYFLPSLEWTGFFNQTIAQAPTVSGTVTQSIYVGDIVLQHIRKHSQLNLDY